MSLIINGESLSKGICIGQAIHIDKNNRQGSRGSYGFHRKIIPKWF